MNLERLKKKDTPNSRRQAMSKPLLILNLIIKTLVEFVIVATFVTPIIIIVFIAGYLAYSTSNAIDTFRSANKH